MAQAFWVLLLVHVVFASIFSADLLLRRKEPMATLAWLEAIVLVPGLGALLYLLFGSESIHRRRYGRRHLIRSAFEARLARNPLRLDAPVPTCAPDGPAFGADALAVAIATSRRRPTRGNAVRLFASVPALYDDLERAVAAAERYVHFEYYVFQPDRTGRHFLDLLTARARDGIEVRLLLDAVGSRGLGAEHLGPLERAGGQVGWFLPLRNVPSPLAIHLRNHRKIVVVDGRLAYTGGVNIGDEYRGRHARRTSWSDAHLRIEGPAAHDLQEIFAEDWKFATGADVLAGRYFPDPTPAGDDIVQVVPSGPDDPSRALHATLFQAIASARERVWVATAYFVPDEAIAAALTTAARRGVDVRLLVSEKTDHPLVDRAGESFLPALLHAGVRVYRYEAGMLHSKLAAIDGQWGILGSANMDIRSFRLNFEVNVSVLSCAWTAQVETLFGQYLIQASPYTRAHVAALPLHRRLAVAACRTLAPIL